MGSSNANTGSKDDHPLFRRQKPLGCKRQVGKPGNVFSLFGEALEQMLLASEKGRERGGWRKGKGSQQASSNLTI
jgi:hypothetical protein